MVTEMPSERIKPGIVTSGNSDSIFRESVLCRGRQNWMVSP